MRTLGGGKIAVVRSSLIYTAVGITIALGTIAIAWWFGEIEFITRMRWKITAIIMLGAELVIVLFIPANKGGQPFDSHSFPIAGPPVSSPADFHDAYPSRQLGDLRWLLVGLPILIAGIGLLIVL